MSKRFCCIENCNSSSVDKENQRTLFKFSAKSEHFDIWLNAIGHNLKKDIKSVTNLYICEIHFKKSCFPQSPIKMLRDGVEIELRKCLILKSVSHQFSLNALKFVKQQLIDLWKTVNNFL